MFLLTWVFATSLAWAQDHSSETQSLVRVRIRQDASAVQITGFGIRVVGDNGTFRLEPGEILPKYRRIKVIRAIRGWKVVREGKTLGEENFLGEELRVSGSILKVDGLEAADELAFRAEGARFDVVALLPMGEYLKGVLPSEMPAQWPREALKAQAVAARSYALSLIRERKERAFDVDDSVLHQVFKPQNFSRARSSDQEKVLTALRETAGVYLSDAAGQPYRAYFHADCGGSTEEAKHVWDIQAKYGTVLDERCETNPRGVWAVQIPTSELERVLKKYTGLEGDIKLVGFAASPRTDTQRVREVTARFARHPAATETRAIHTQEFRRLFGYDRVKSTNFEMEYSAQGLALRGRGHGHGVGMCQRGARFMALAGATYLEILKRYYSQAQISKPIVVGEYNRR